jgi:DNA-binding MarR family transcriptional regulator
MSGPWARGPRAGSSTSVASGERPASAPDIRSVPKHPKHPKVSNPLAAKGNSLAMDIVAMYGIPMSSPNQEGPRRRPASTKATPGFLVWRLSMKWRVAVDRAVGPLGLTHAQYSLVASLYGMHHDGIRPSQRQLADHTGLEALYVSKLARALESSGLVERTRDARDPRAVRLSLTEHGRDTAQRAIKVVHELLRQLLEPLGGLDSAHTRNFVRDLATLLDAPLDPFRATDDSEPSNEKNEKEQS